MGATAVTFAALVRRLPPVFHGAVTMLRRLSTVLPCVWLLSATTLAIGQGSPAPHCAPLASVLFPADTARATSANGARFRSLVDTVTANLARLEIHVTTLAPGKSPHPPHRHPHEEIMIVRSGTLEVFQNSATRLASAGAVIFEAANELHGLRNPGPDSATYVVIRIDPHDLVSADSAPCRAAPR